jgi:ABC-type antimicrobial peptide transport system permease subunit
MLHIGVEQRRREIGVRMALGARGREVVLMFFKRGLRVAFTGLAFGLPLSIAGLAYLTLRTTMQEQSVVGIATVVTVAVVGVAAFASWLPARRAAAVDPMVALRSE